MVRRIILTEEQIRKVTLSEMTSSEIDLEARNTDTNPTEAQTKAGNYRKAHVRVKGLPIAIETPKGCVRSGKDKNGKEWSIVMKNHYGYFNLTDGDGKDGDAIDVFLGPDIDNFDNVYVVDQKNTKGEFDESKVMLGFTSKEQAKNAYMSNYSDDWKGFMAITGVSFKFFKKWLYDKQRQRKPFKDYVDVRKKKIVEGLNKFRANDEIEIKIIESKNHGMKKVTKFKEVKYFHPDGKKMPDATYTYKGSFVAECNENAKKFILPEGVHEVQYGLEYWAGGMIILSTDVNALELSNNKLINKIKQLILTAKQRSKRKDLIHKAIVSTNNANTGEAEIGGYSIGNFFKGRYIGDKGKVFNEKSLCVEADGISSTMLLKLAEKIAEQFHQEVVLVKDFNNGKIYYADSIPLKDDETVDDQLSKVNKYSMFGTYNQKHFNQDPDTIEYKSKEWNDVYGSKKDGWVMGRVNRDIRNLNDIVKGKEHPLMDVLLSYAENDIDLAREHNLNAQAEYLEKLLKKAKETIATKDNN